MNHEKKIDNVLCKFRGKIIRRLIDLILLHVSHWMKLSGSCHSKSHFLALGKENSEDEMLSLGLDEFESLCCCSVTKSCLTLCDPRDCSTPGFPILHHLPEFVQTHVHWIGDAIQPSHPLTLSSPFVFNQGSDPWKESILYKITY